MNKIPSFERNADNPRKKFKVENIYERGVSTLNEDALLAENNIFGVFDGASSLDAWKDRSGKTGGFLASNIVKETLRGASDEQPLKEQMLTANERIAKEMAAHDIDTSKKSNRWAVAAAVIRVQDRKFEWVQIGDSCILVLYKDGSYENLGDSHDFDVRNLILWRSLIKRGERSAFANREMIEKFVENRDKSNVDYGFLNGEMEAEKFIASGEKSLKGVASILIFTDGLTIPKENPEENDNFDELLKLYKEGGLGKVKEFIRRQEENDPEFQRYPRFKKHDDIATIAINF